MADKRLKEVALEMLKLVKRNGPFDASYGICYQIDSHLFDYDSKDVYDLIADYARDWPHYSGNGSYPIPTSNKRMTAEEYYDARDRKWRGKQGQYRYELIDHIILGLEQDLELSK